MQKEYFKNYFWIPPSCIKVFSMFSVFLPPKTFYYYYILFLLVSFVVYADNNNNKKRRTTTSTHKMYTKTIIIHNERLNGDNFNLFLLHFM